MLTVLALAAVAISGPLQLAGHNGTVTNTANAEEEDIRANLELYLGMSDASQLIEIIDEKPKAFDMLIALITDQLTSN